MMISSRPGAKHDRQPGLAMRDAPIKVDAVTINLVRCDALRYCTRHPGV